MQPTTLQNLIAENVVNVLPNGLQFQVDQKWIVPGEDRVSYTTILRLTECCREHHWKKDVCSVVSNLDSILCTLRCRFISPISPGTTVSIYYHVSKVWSDRYILSFDIESSVHHARIDMTCVFYDPAKRSPLKAPAAVIGALKGMRQHEE